MKTTIVLALAIFCSSIAVGQDAVVKKMLVSFCNGFDKVKQFSEQELSDCITKSIVDNEHELMKECYRIYKDTSYETGYRFGQEVSFRVLLEAIGTCKSYYLAMDTLRIQAYTADNKDVVRKEIEEFNKNVPDSAEVAFFFRRGTSYFAISEYDQALNDLNKALSVNNRLSQVIYLKALTLEMLGKYDEAIGLFEQLADKEKKPHYSIAAAIVRRKKSGR
ncbi:MAG TPA: CDC27 family protein [Chitinophagaceae bacterium]|nr:CDC27 family protein [Chitinophagaceae bacterium]